MQLLETGMQESPQGLEFLQTLQHGPVPSPQAVLAGAGAKQEARTSMSRRRRHGRMGTRKMRSKVGMGWLPSSVPRPLRSEAAV